MLQSLHCARLGDARQQHSAYPQPVRCGGVRGFESPTPRGRPRALRVRGLDGGIHNTGSGGRVAVCHQNLSRCGVKALPVAKMSAPHERSRSITRLRTPGITRVVGSARSATQRLLALLDSVCDSSGAATGLPLRDESSIAGCKRRIADGKCSIGCIAGGKRSLGILTSPSLAIRHVMRVNQLLVAVDDAGRRPGWRGVALDSQQEPVTRRTKGNKLENGTLQSHSAAHLFKRSSLRMSGGASSGFAGL